MEIVRSQEGVCIGLKNIENVAQPVFIGDSISDVRRKLGLKPEDSVNGKWHNDVFMEFDQANNLALLGVYVHTELRLGSYEFWQSDLDSEEYLPMKDLKFLNSLSYWLYDDTDLCDNFFPQLNIMYRDDKDSAKVIYVYSPHFLLSYMSYYYHGKERFYKDYPSVADLFFPQRNSKLGPIRVVNLSKALDKADKKTSSDKPPLPPKQ